MAEHTEAKVLVFYDLVSPSGVKYSMTFREGVTLEAAQEVVTTAIGIQNQCTAKGWTPYGKPPAQQQQDPEQGEDDPGEGWCPIHNLRMTQRTNENGSWWSHKAGGEWCKGS